MGNSFKHPVLTPKPLRDLLETLKGIDRHGMTKILGMSEIGKRLTKKSRADKSPRPVWLDEDTMCYSWLTTSLKHDYGKAVQNKQDQAGYEKNFEAQESNISDLDPDFPNEVVRQGKIKRDDDGNIVKDNSAQKYVRTYPSLSANKNVESRYINGEGVDITDRITPEIRANFFPVRKESKKQAEYGVEGEAQVRVSEYKAQNIIYVQKGEKVVFNALNKRVLDLFDLEYVN